MTAIVTPTPIDDLPTAPLPTDTIPVFNANAFALVAALEDFVDQTNAIADATEQNATAANERAVLADASAGAAALSESAAAASAASALNSPGTNATSTTSLTVTTGVKSFTLAQTGKLFAPGQPIVLSRQADPTVQMAGTLLTHNSGTGACTANMTSAQGATGPHTDWDMNLGIVVSSSNPANLVREARTSNTALVQADIGKWIEITSGTFTQTFGTRSAGWWAILGNSGSGDIGLTTDGVTYKMYTGEKRYVIYDGTNDYSIVINAYARTWTASDTWVKPPGYAGHGGRQWAGGGSGRRAALGTGDPICGGGGGACTDFYFTQAELPSTVAFMIGSGGAAQTTNSTNGNAGGTSGFNGVFAYGGPGGANGATDGANAYISSNTNAAIAGAKSATVGLYGGGNVVAAGVTVKSTVYGGGSGATLETGGTVTTGATTIFGGPGGTTNAAGTAPTAGTTPGGGGGASTNGTASGAGARGELRMWGVI